MLHWVYCLTVFSSAHAYRPVGAYTAARASERIGIMSQNDISTSQEVKRFLLSWVQKFQKMLKLLYPSVLGMTIRLDFLADDSVQELA